MTFSGDWETDCSIMYCFLEAVEFYNGNESRKMNNKRGVSNGRMLYGNTWKMFIMYDKVTGEAIFSPLSHSRINLIKGEMAIRKDRLHKEKDILQAITPWILQAFVCLV